MQGYKMETIQLQTVINGPIHRCFDLARSIDFHQETTSSTNEKAIAGTTSGLINKGETVTWKAKHFGIYQQLSSVISEMNPPFFFEDRMIKGAFKSIRHRHYFEEQNGITTMKDLFEFEAPFGLLGRLFSRLVLKNYLEGFIIERNRMLRIAAESEEWKKYLK
jgi:ligand-binding SRPBCC domain-containing protein